MHGLHPNIQRRLGYNFEDTAELTNCRYILAEGGLEVNVGSLELELNGALCDSNLYGQSLLLELEAGTDTSCKNGKRIDKVTMKLKFCPFQEGQVSAEIGLKKKDGKIGFKADGSM